jgi:hypothetical protein
LVDVLDARRFKTYFQTSLAGLTAAQAFGRGDLNGDFDSNYADFRIFKLAYNQQVGNGAFEAAFASPEPSTLTGAALAAMALLVARRKRGRST